MDEDDFTYDQDDLELDENGLIVEDDDDDYSNITTIDEDDADNNTNDNSEDSDEDDEDDEDGEDDDGDSQKGGRFEGRSAQVNQRKQKYMQGLHKKLDKGITKTFARPTSQIPDDIKDSTQQIKTGIKDTAEKINTDEFLKPHEKAPAIAQTTISTVKSASKKVGSETAKKAIKEAIKSFLKPALPWIAGFAVVFILILILIYACSSAIAAAEGKTQPENMTESSEITSEYFYGTRSVYIDDVALSSALQQSYKQYIFDIITDIETDNPSIDVTLEIPEIDVQTKEPKPIGETSVTHYTNMSIAIGNIVATNSSDYSGVSFETLYPQISYFGLTSSQVSSVNDFLTKYFTDNNLVLLGNSGKTVDELIDEAISDENLQYILNICEKVMLKDEIATENGIMDIQQRNYLASIYMPNNNITINSNSVCVATTTPENTITFSSIIKSGDRSTQLSHAKTLDDGKNIIDPIDGTSISLSKFTAIDEGNYEALSGGVSLFEAIRLLSADLFAKNDSNVYTWMPTTSNFMYLEFEGSSPFIFTDLKMDIATE